MPPKTRVRSKGSSRFKVKLGQQQCKYACPICGKKFKRLYGLERHHTTLHKSASSEFLCDNCGKQFSRKDYLDSHSKACGENSKKKDKCPLCDFVGSKFSLRQHYSTDHDIQIESDIKTFTSFDEFKVWKSDYEVENIARYVKVTDYKRIDGSHVYFFGCYRNGHYHYKGKNERISKSQGSNKINGWCPSEMKVMIDKEKEVTVIYTTTHVGHKNDLERIPIPKAQKDEIAKKLAAKVPMKKILNDIRDNLATTGSLKRIHLLTYKDLENIRMAYKIKVRAPRQKLSQNKIHMGSSDVSQKEMTYESDNSPVRFLKERNCTSALYPQLASDNFTLVIMTNAQAQHFKTFGKKCVCVASISKKKASSFELVALVTADDNGQSLPCAFLYTNLVNSMTIEVFFSVVKDVVNSIDTELFLSDMRDTFYSVWCEVMGTPDHRRYCSFHVWNAWKANLSLMVFNQALRNTVIDNLSVILEELNPDNFQTLLEQFVSDLHDNTETKAFAVYFDENFRQSANSWAYCYQSPVGANVDSQVERIHCALQYLSSQGKCGKKVGIFLNAVMRFLRITTCNRMGITEKKYKTSKRLDMKKKHSHAKQMNCQIVEYDTHWCVLEKNKSLKIKTANINCECELRCDDCTACIHSLQCSCLDSALKWNMCKHIHYFCMTTLVNGEICESQVDMPCVDNATTDRVVNSTMINNEEESNDSFDESGEESLESDSESLMETENEHTERVQEPENENVSEESVEKNTEETDGEVVEIDYDNSNCLENENIEGHDSVFKVNTSSSQMDIVPASQVDNTDKCSRGDSALEFKKDSFKKFLESLLKEVTSDEQLEVMKEAVTPMLELVKSFKTPSEVSDMEVGLSEEEQL